jgi:hypothetical protein
MPKVPALSPIMVPRFICSECGALMRIVINVQKNQKVAQNGIDVMCDNCQYGFKPASPYASGESSVKSYSPPIEKPKITKDIVEMRDISKPKAKAAAD